MASIRVLKVIQLVVVAVKCYENSTNFIRDGAEPRKIDV